MAFAVKKMKWDGGFDKDKDMVFEKVLTNIGANFYSRAAVKFECFTAGLYKFSVYAKASLETLRKMKLGYIAALVVHRYNEGINKEIMYISSIESSKQRLIKLNKGDTVWVVLKRGAKIERESATFEGVMLYSSSAY